MPHAAYTAKDLDAFPVWQKVTVTIVPLPGAMLVTGRNDGTGIQYEEVWPQMWSEVYLDEDDPALGEGGGGGGSLMIYTLPPD
jgi:hypothetical protein